VCGAEVVYEDGTWHHARIESGTHDAEPIVELMTMLDQAEMKVKELSWVYVVRTLWDDGSDQEDVFLRKDTAFAKATSFAETHLLTGYVENDELYAEWSNTDGQISVSVRMAKFSAR